MESKYVAYSPCEDLGHLRPYSRCHLGKVIRYDTVTQQGWSVDVRTHGIKVIIDRLLASDWDSGDNDDKNSTHKAVPDFYDEEDCIVSAPRQRLGTHHSCVCYAFRTVTTGSLVIIVMSPQFPAGVLGCDRYVEYGSGYLMTSHLLVSVPSLCPCNSCSSRG